MCVIIFNMDIYVHCIYVHGSMERKNMFFSIIYNYNIYHLIFLSYISDIKFKKKRKKKEWHALQRISSVFVRHEVHFVEVNSAF